MAPYVCARCVDRRDSCVVAAMHASVPPSAHADTTSSNPDHREHQDAASRQPVYTLHTAPSPLVDSDTQAPSRARPSISIAVRHTARPPMPAGHHSKSLEPSATTSCPATALHAPAASLFSRSPASCCRSAHHRHGLQPSLSARRQHKTGACVCRWAIRHHVSTQRAGMLAKRQC